MTGPGNQTDARTDLTGMGCNSCREHLSADLDGEADPVALPAVHAHLASCPDCTRWFHYAGQVNRLTRTAPADPGPGLSERQLSELLVQLPRRRRRRVTQLTARWALAAVGAGQATLATVSLALSSSSATHDHPALLGADLVHMSRESSAWNLALGVAFLAGAWWVRHLAGLLPVLGTFVLVLSLVSALDLMKSNVEPGRVLAHLLVLAGLGLVVLIVATGPAQFRPTPARGRFSRHPGAVPRGETEQRFPLAQRGRHRPDPAARRHVA